MKKVITVASILLFSAFLVAVSQQPAPKLTPEEIRMAQQNEKLMMDSIAASKAHPGPTYTDLRCRADAQSWTSDGSDKTTMIFGATGIMVNGQMRWIPRGATPHLPMSALMETYS